MINRRGEMKKALLILFCVSFLIGCSSTKHDGSSTGKSPTNHQNGSSIASPPDVSGPSGPHPGNEEVKTIRVDTPRLDNLKNVILPQVLPDGSLYFIGLSKEGKGQVLYLAPGAEHPAVYAVSKYPNGQISEIFVNEQWVTWVDLSVAMDWSLYVQRRGTSTVQKLASSDDQGTTKKGVDPLSPRIDDGKLVFVEPGPDNATNIVGIDAATGVRVRFTTSGLASLPSISDGHILYGEIHADDRAGGIWWMTSWENETRTKLFDTLVYPPELVYPMLTVYMMEGERRLRIENLADNAFQEIPIPGAYDVIYDLSQEYLVWHKTVDATISALSLSDGSRYTIVGPADYRILRPKVTGKTLLFEGYNQSDEWALFTVELP
jgi:hypothetical protein